MTKATASKHRIAWGRYLLIFFVAAWMFVLGVLVGRGTAPVAFDTQALQKELAALRDAMMQKEREALEKAIRGEDEQAPLEFYEALKTDDPDTAIATPGPRLPHEVPGASQKSADTASPPHKRRATIMAKQAVVVKKTVSASQPEPKPPAPDRGHYTIQVVSMKDGAAAEGIVANLKKDGYSAYLSRMVIPGQGLWFRVRVGSYPNRDQAAADMTRLTLNKKKPILVQTE